MKKRSKVQELVLTSLFMAIVIVMSVIPNTGYINIGAISIAIVHIPVIVGAILLGWRMGILIGAAFGIGSFINALTAPLLLAPVFLNPIVSVLPRIIFGGVVYFIYKGISSLPYLKNQKYISYAVTAIISTLVHTAMVVPLMYTVGLGFPDIAAAVFQGASMVQFFIVILVANGVFEAVAAGILVPIILRALKSVEEKD